MFVDTKLYFDFHLPLALKELIEDLLGKKNFDPQNPATPADTSTREWFSQPRPATDPTVEVVTVNFKLPLSVSEFSAEFLRVSSHAEVWYKDRSNNWRQVLDRQRVPLALDLSHSEGVSWYRYSARVYPIVAKAVQLRIVRTPDPTVTGIPYSVGARNTLIKRNIYERNQGVLDLEDEQDVLGNVIEKYIKDWDPSQAVDADATTFWKSAPQPDPGAVVSLYLDIRNASGGPQTVDRIYLDPVHSGQHLNVYYSSDDTVEGRRLSPISLLPTANVNTDWRAGLGLSDLVGTETSRYAVSAQWGPQYRQDAWVGLEWYPDFDAADGPSLHPVLFRAAPSAAGQAYAPELTYDPGAGVFNLNFRREGYTTINYSAPIVGQFPKDEPLRIVVGWAYEPSRVVLSVVDRRGAEVATAEVQTGTLPELVTFDGTVEFVGFRGRYTATVVKLEAYEASRPVFQANPTVYVNPDPVLPDAAGRVPASSLDNAIYAADWTQQRFGVGGTDATEFTGKTWTPVWQNYVVEKGTLFLPQMLSAKYLKLEFTNLTEEPYPVYEPGIDVTYKVFPISVQQTATMGPRLFTGAEVGGLFGVANLNGVKSVNWHSPSSVLGAVGQVLGPQYDPVRVDAGAGYVTTAVPHLVDSPISDSYRAELSSRHVYRREELEPFILAQDQYNTVIKGEGLMKIQPYTSIPWEEIYAANPGAIETHPVLGAVPVRGTDMWLFPGQEIRVPASVMERITSTSTVTERRATIEHRIRFTTSAVHRYETRTVRRDAAVGYFASLREVVPMVASYTFGQDKDRFDFPLYSADQWTLTNIRHTTAGPITWDGNGDFGTAYFAFQTYSNFVKLFADFRDSGLLRSDALWASANSDNLSPKASLIPENPDTVAWLDSFVDWTDAEGQWGAPRGVVAINLDGDRRYQGRRVLRFSRVAGAGEAGIRLQQATNFIDGGLFRLGAVLYRPVENDNQILLRLVRRSDAAVVYETLVEAAAGRWVDFTTPLQEVPDGVQDYDLELVMRGDEADELFLSDVYSEVAHVRYYLRAGDSSQPLYEVTDLRYRNSAQVVAQTPVNQGTVQVSILSPKGFAYGLTLTPAYLQ